MLKDYDDKLLCYITSYVEEIGVPPTVDQMLENVEGITSKSSVHYHLKKLVASGFLVQKNVKGYYYPTSLESNVVVSIPNTVLEKVLEEMKSKNCNSILVQTLESYVKQGTRYN